VNLRITDHPTREGKVDCAVVLGYFGSRGEQEVVLDTDMAAFAEVHHLRACKLKPS
jgi:hypothetical protein